MLSHERNLYTSEMSGLFDGECLFAFDSFLVNKIEIRLDFDREKLRACCAGRRLGPLILPPPNKDEPRI